MFTNIQAFHFFLLGDSDATEQTTDDRPCNPAGHDRPDGVGGTAQSLDAELRDSTTIEESDASCQRFWV